MIRSLDAFSILSSRVAGRGHNLVATEGTERSPWGSYVEESLLTSMTPLSRGGLVGSLVEEILALIRHEQLRPGQRLPTAKALAERFDVAVPTVREAIQRLEAIGVVRVRHGAGIFVKAEHPRMMFSQSGAAGIDAQVILDLIETRLLLEPYLAEHAAQVASGDGVARVRDLLHQAERQLSNKDHELQRANMAFHLGIARCSDNVVLTQVMETLVDLYDSEQTAMLAIGDTRLADYEEHVAIFEAVEAGDSEQARSLMRQHLERARDLMSARLAAAEPAKVVWLNAAGSADRSRTSAITRADGIASPPVA